MMEEMELRNTEQGYLLSLHGDATDNSISVVMVCERDNILPASLGINITNEEAKKFGQWLIQMSER